MNEKVPNMYLDQIRVENFRSFRKQKQPIEFLHPDQAWRDLPFPKPKYPNVNVLLGDNGSGKSTLLKAVAMSALGPVAPRSQLPVYRYVRQEPDGYQHLVGQIEAVFSVDHSDHTDVSQVKSQITIRREGDYEDLAWKGEEEKWQPVFKSESNAFFVVGYGVTRITEKNEERRPAGQSPIRTQRIRSLFEDNHQLRSFTTWLIGREKREDREGRCAEVIDILNALLGKGHLKFEGHQGKDGEFLFGRGGLKIPFPALSDGYRAFIGWASDLLFHLCQICPDNQPLKEQKGIVLVDEIDLHLHPKWQMTVLPRLSKALPNMQFIVTSHSPLIVGSLEWMNIIAMKSGPKQSSKVERIKWAVHGLNADQVLLTDFFGMQSTRATGKLKKIKHLSLQASDGDVKAARRLLEIMAQGEEER